MRRLLALLAVSVGALALVPVTSASAATFAGACTISGTASFPSPGLQNVPQTLGYNFAGPGTCVGSLNGGTPASHAVTANASGSGTLSCAASVSTGGTASVAFTGGPTFNFTIDLQGAGSEVNFVIHDAGGGAGAGHATFAEEITRAPECAAGITSIGFDVVAGAVKLVE
jgi:hypothetical protein